MATLEFTSSSPSETRALAAAVAGILEGGDVVLLAGDLGTGKTCFVQGAAAALGVTRGVTSPTFVLVREYRGRVRIVHADAYRLNSLAEMEDIGIEDLFASDTVTFVEWGDAVEATLPPERLEVALQRGDGDQRRIVLRPRGDSWEARARALADAAAGASA